MLDIIISVLTVKTLLVGLITGLVAYWIRRRYRYKLPPGPFPLPLVGNILQFKSNMLHEELYELSKKYGPVVSIYLGPMLVITINDIDPAMEALVKKGTDFSNKFRTTSLEIVSDGGKDIAFSDYGPTWRIHRKMAAKALRHYMQGEALEGRVHDAVSVIFEEMKKETKPFDPEMYINFIVCNILSGLCFGGNNFSSKKPKPCQQEHIEEIPKFVWARLKAIPVMWPVEVREKRGDLLEVFVKADNALRTIRMKDTVPFPGEYKRLRQLGLGVLGKRNMKTLLKVFKEDTEWFDHCLHQADSKSASRQDESYHGPDMTDRFLPPAECSSPVTQDEIHPGEDMTDHFIPQAEARCPVTEDESHPGEDMTDHFQPPAECRSPVTKDEIHPGEDMTDHFIPQAEPRCPVTQDESHAGEDMTDHFLPQAECRSPVTQDETVPGEDVTDNFIPQAEPRYPVTQDESYHGPDMTDHFPPQAECRSPVTKDEIHPGEDMNDHFIPKAEARCAVTQDESHPGADMTDHFLPQTECRSPVTQDETHPGEDMTDSFIPQAEPRYPVTQEESYHCPDMTDHFLPQAECRSPVTQDEIHPGEDMTDHFIPQAEPRCSVTQDESHAGEDMTDHFTACAASSLITQDESQLGGDMTEQFIHKVESRSSVTQDDRYPGWDMTDHCPPQAEISYPVTQDESYPGLDISYSCLPQVESRSVITPDENYPDPDMTSQCLLKAESRSSVTHDESHSYTGSDTTENYWSGEETQKETVGFPVSFVGEWKCDEVIVFHSRDSDYDNDQDLDTRFSDENYPSSKTKPTLPQAISRSPVMQNQSYPYADSTSHCLPQADSRSSVTQKETCRGSDVSDHYLLPQQESGSLVRQVEDYPGLDVTDCKRLKSVSSKTNSPVICVSEGKHGKSSVFCSADPDSDPGYGAHQGSFNRSSNAERHTYSKNHLESIEVDDDESDSNSDYVEDSNFEDSDTNSNQLFSNPELKRKPLKEKHILRDINQPGIYIRKVRKKYRASKAQAGRKKEGSTRNYDNYHACLFCGTLQLHIPTHMKIHQDRPEVKEILASTKPGTFPDYTKLRKLGDHKHNRKVTTEGIGEIILSRRPKDLDIAQFGPCPRCKQWVKLKLIRLHYKRCSKNDKVSKRLLIIQSQVLSGVIDSKPSKLMLEEVFPSMLSDDIGNTAKKDPLIVALGETWLRRSIDNKEKRRYYTSQHMRLVARLLMHLRESSNTSEESSSLESSSTGATKTSSESMSNTSESDSRAEVINTSGAEELSLTHFIQTKYFDSVVEAAIKCCVPYMDDVEDLQSPSNGIKLKYDFKRIVSAKWALIVKSDPHSLVAKEMKTLLELITLEWGEKLTKVARTVLLRRSLQLRKELPSPEDIQKLTQHVINELKSISLEKKNYFRVVKLAETRLLMYNRRRSGEIECIRLERFAAKTSNIEDLDQSLVGELTEVEKYLLKSQEMMQVRGKGTRPVPVLIPLDCKKPLEFLASYEKREMVDVPETNKYLFPNTENSYSRAYESLKSISSECCLQAPGRITSVNMRKYTATLTQMLNLHSYELEWLCRHLGHTTDIHKGYYRNMSGLVERVQLSKLFIMQDMNLSEKFKGKSLDEIDIADIIFPTDAAEVSASKGLEETVTTGLDQIDQSENQTFDPVVFEDVGDEFDDDDYEPEDAEDESVSEEDVRPQKKKHTKKVVRQRWVETEVKELNQYFSSYLSAKITPGTKQVEHAKKQSKARGGMIWQRSNDKIIKKNSNMNHKY